MAQSFGESQAKEFADAHEVGNLVKDSYGKNSPGKAMDLFNNCVGRELAKKTGGK